MMIDSIAFVPRHISMGVCLPHSPKLFHGTGVHRRLKSGRWLSRCRELLRITGGRKTTDSRN